MTDTERVPWPRKINSALQMRICVDDVFNEKRSAKRENNVRLTNNKKNKNMKR